jgi:hypothetical protein
MNSSISTFNPARFIDVVKESSYANAWNNGRELKAQRNELIEWLRKKYKDNQACQDLANKLETCKRDARCKSAACPECSNAAQRLVTEVTRRFLKEKAKTATSVCVSIVQPTARPSPAN